MNIDDLLLEHPVLEDISNKTPVFVVNDHYIALDSYDEEFDFSLDDIKKADRLLRRFAPLLEKLFPELKSTRGIIESPLQRLHELPKAYNSSFNVHVPNNVYVKRDDILSIAGSVKARGGIYEVLKIAERIADDEMIFESDENYCQFKSDRFKSIFKNHKILCGSTGNLALSIGIVAAKLGFKTEVHMSKDGKEWKKDLLRHYNVEVVEHESDYSEAVKRARIEALKSKKSHFIDDEDSKDLFMGYAVSALRLKEQLDQAQINVSESNPLYVYLPCGVGGAPGGISFGLKMVFGAGVRPIFCEPVEAPAVTLGVITGMHSDVSVKDFGLLNNTVADGLAVGRSSRFVGDMLQTHIFSFVTATDADMLKTLTVVQDNEGIKIEPSASIGYYGPIVLHKNIEVEPSANHLIWSTGGNLLPNDDYNRYYNEGARFL